MITFQTAIQITQSILIIALATIVAMIFKRFFKKSVEKHKSNRVGKPESFHTIFHKKSFAVSFRMSETRHRILLRVIQAFVFVIAFSVIVYMIPPLRTLSYSLLAGAGIAAVIIGFAVQKSFANIFAGIFIGIYEPFRIGDFIRFADKTGVIEDITLHHTVIREWRNRRYIIPNSIISDQLIENYTISSSKMLKTFEVGISYDSDIDLAREIILEEVRKQPELLIPEEKEGDKIVKQWPNVKVVDWGESSLKLRIAFWVPNPLVGYRMKFKVLESVQKRFKQEGVEIPYPYRTLVYKKNLKKPKKMRKVKKTVKKVVKKTKKKSPTKKKK
jgi:small conductance mechanosensitive channel